MSRGPWKNRERTSVNGEQHTMKDYVDANLGLQLQPVEAPTRWRVTKAGYFSMNGYIARVALGQIVTLNAYGTDGIARMLARGITIEPIS